MPTRVWKILAPTDQSSVTRSAHTRDGLQPTFVLNQIGISTFSFAISYTLNNPRACPPMSLTAMMGIANYSSHHHLHCCRAYQDLCGCWQACKGDSASVPTNSIINAISCRSSASANGYQQVRVSGATAGIYQRHAAIQDGRVRRVDDYRGDIIEMIRADRSLMGITSRGGWMVFEVAQDFGMGTVFFPFRIHQFSSNCLFSSSRMPP